MLQQQDRYKSILRDTMPNPRPWSTAIHRRHTLVQKHRPVQGVALYRLETSIADDLPQLLLGRRIGSFGEQNAANIVAPEAQPHLGRRPAQARGRPMSVSRGTSLRRVPWDKA